jgi:hypothetical protein
MNRFLATHQTPHVGSIQMSVTIAAVIGNVCLSRRWKTEHVSFRTCIQPQHVFALPVGQIPDQASICPVYQESDQHRDLSSKTRNDQTMYRIRPYP